MMLTVVAIGGTLLAATTVAGLLVVYQVRQSSDAVNSAKAIFAADAGIDWALYRLFKPDLEAGSGPVFSNSASVTDSSTSCVPEGDCANVEHATIKATGRSAGVVRALELSF